MKALVLLIWQWNVIAKFVHFFRTSSLSGAIFALSNVALSNACDAAIAICSKVAFLRAHAVFLIPLGYGWDVACPLSSFPWIYWTRVRSCRSAQKPGQACADLLLLGHKSTHASPIHDNTNDNPKDVFICVCESWRIKETSDGHEIIIMQESHERASTAGTTLNLAVPMKHIANQPVLDSSPWGHALRCENNVVGDAGWRLLLLWVTLWRWSCLTTIWQTGLSYWPFSGSYSAEERFEHVLQAHVKQYQIPYGETSTTRMENMEYKYFPQLWLSPGDAIIY